MKIKRILSAALIVLLIGLQIGMVVWAEEEERIKQESFDTPPDTNGLPNWPTGPNVHAHAAIVLDINSKAIVYAKNINEVFYPASITKYLTALIALENAELEDIIYMSEESVFSVDWGYAHIGMKPEEELTLEDALYALLLASANEVAYAIAENVGTAMGGDYDTFIQAMNDRAVELGAINSRWQNASGVHAENHYTTAYDMALITAAFHQRPEYQQFLEVLEHTIEPTELTEEERNLFQNHQMLWEENPHFYEYADGGKTGFTNQAGTTLVTTADNGELQFVAVVLHDYGVEAYNGTRAMLDYAFDNFSKVSLIENDQGEDIETFHDPEAYILLPDTVTFAEVEREFILTNGKQAQAIYTYHGQVVGVTEVTLSHIYFERVAAAEAEELAAAEQEQASRPVEEATNESNPILLVVAVILAILLGLLIIVNIIMQRKRRQRKE